MKQLVAVLLTILPILTYGQDVVFDSHIHNFGTIAEVDGVVSHTFKYTNNGTSPFVITTVATSCGCTNPTYSTAPLQPGASGTLTIQFNPTDRPGRFDKNIYITFNAGIVNLSIIGVVTPRPRTIKDDFPFPVGAELRASELLPRIEPAPQNRATPKTITIVNNSYIPINVALDTSTLPAWLSVKIQKPFLNPAQKTTITLTTRPTTMWGQQSTSIPIIVNGERQAEKIHLTTTFTRDFSEINRTDAPKAEFSSYFYHFSTQKIGTQPSHTIKIRNNGKSTLYIDHIQPSSKHITYSISRTAIPVGATANLTLSLTIMSDNYTSESVRIITSDPFSPIREIRLVANGF